MKGKLHWMKWLSFAIGRWFKVTIEVPYDWHHAHQPRQMRGRKRFYRREVINANWL